MNKQKLINDLQDIYFKVCGTKMVGIVESGDDAIEAYVYQIKRSLGIE